MRRNEHDKNGNRAFIISSPELWSRPCFLPTQRHARPEGPGGGTVWQRLRRSAGPRAQEEVGVQNMEVQSHERQRRLMQFEPAKRASKTLQSVEPTTLPFDEKLAIRAALACDSPLTRNFIHYLRGNEMSANKKKSLIDFTDEELLEAYRNSIKDAQWSPANYRKEMFWRTQERNTTAYNRWTSVIALATLINSLAIIIQLLKGLGVL